MKGPTRLKKLVVMSISYQQRILVVRLELKLLLLKKTNSKYVLGTGGSQFPVTVIPQSSPLELSKQKSSHEDDYDM
jgi:hypothetical protein